MRQPVILYFVNGPVVTNEEKLAAYQIRATVKFRNALAVTEKSSCLEKCDGVAGCVPNKYKGQPSVEEAMDNFNLEMQGKIKSVSETPKDTGNLDGWSPN